MQLTLENVKQAFDLWRTERSKHGPIPEYLTEQAISLVGRYTKIDITSALGINHSALKRWLNKKTVQTHFVPLHTPAEIAVTPTAPNTIELTIDFNKGMQIRLHGSPVNTAQFVNQLQQRGEP